MYHGTSDRNEVGIVISETFRNYVAAVDCISDRLMGAKVDLGKVTMRIISVYAPQVGCTAEEKNSFYEDHEHAILEGARREGETDGASVSPWVYRQE
ncbi:hypothetical protein Y032_0082g1533 [Ancylostoma ceylanicum]|uniref:Uncharacterized protein n=1 Tax=Ancylostoma ceylanicum TaxID=53326 RepID=A0A016TRH3_9BILA|nr:hypothetical protein Y032_0082g1533 [Ancylostoma ceylanicum]